MSTENCKCTIVPVLSGESTDVDPELFVDWAPTIPCEFGGHSRSEHGCQADEPARFLIRITHGRANGPCEPLVIGACESKVIRLRGEWLTTTFCSTCRLSGTVSSFVQIIGPINSHK